MSFSPWSAAFLLATHVFCMATCSMVELKNNGYENLVIAINPALPEDQKIIDNIKDMMTEASAYLFTATQRRVYFKSIKILIPLTWGSDPTYSKAKTESFDKADAIVADPYLKYGNDPYTLQYGGCREPGKYIHFTPNFLTDDSLLAVYGPRGRVFVHEWAHLRWGVFDEYNNDRPFYISGNINVQATMCSKNVQGVYKYIECKGNSCSHRDCRPDVLTGLLEDGCTFIPDTVQNAKASIMYMQALSTVVEFCDSSTHNTEAPNLQNRMCDSNSTWDVIMRSDDFKNSPPISGAGGPPALPTFTLLQTRDRVLCLVLDVSGSMSVSDRSNRLYQAAELFLLQIIETGSSAGIVTFDHAAYITSELQQIRNDNVRKTLVSYLPKRDNGGGTHICAGIRKGFEVNRRSGYTDGTELVVLTDGEDGYDTAACFPDVQNSGAIVHVVALGPNAALALEQIADMSGGLRFYATDNLVANALIDAFAGISSGNGNLSQQSIQLESDGLSLGQNQCLDKTVAIDSTVGNDTFFVVTWQRVEPTIKVAAPNGVTYSNANFNVSTTSRTARLQIPGTAQAGNWDYSLCNPHSSQVLSMTVTSRAANSDVPPVTVKAQMNKDSNSYPHPMVVYAEVSQGYLPVLGANVTAIIETETGSVTILELLDNGAGADIAKNDGVYSKYFTTFSGNGRYSLKVRVQGKDKTTKLGLRMQRSNALYIPGYVENGVVHTNPSRPAVPDEDIQANLESFSRITSGGSFVVSAVPPGPLPDINPPSKITDLDARIADQKIDLSWTAPGDDLDEGQADSYDIRMSTNPQELKVNFEMATAVNISALTPQPAGSLETFSFTPEGQPLVNGTIIYFAVRAIDGGALKSDVSNTAQAALFIPSAVPPSPAPPTTTTPAAPPTTITPAAPPTTTTSTAPPTTTTPAPPPTTTTSTAPPTTTTPAPPPTTTTSTAPPTTTTPAPPPTTTTSTAPPTTTTPAPPPTTTTSAPSKDSSSGSQDVIFLTIIVCSAVVIISLIVSITLCILSCNRNKRRPETGL